MLYSESIDWRSKKTDALLLKEEYAASNPISRLDSSIKSNPKARTKQNDPPTRTNDLSAAASVFQK
jgi:hypothetical protein